MASFSYIAVNTEGKELKGTIDAANYDKASAELKSKGLVVASLGETSALGKDVTLTFLEKKPSARDMAVFCRQFVSIINAGVPLVSALEMLGEQTENKRLSKAITGCKQEIEKGESLTLAMRNYPSVFPSLFITLVEAGEASGSLDVSFTRMAEQFEKESRLKATVKKASIYPIVVLVVALAVVVAMLVFVIPTFETMFDDLGTDLPGITLAVIGASRFMQNYWYFLIVGVFALVVLIRAYAHSDSGRHVFGQLGMKLPLVGPLTVKSSCARLARTLSTLLSSGVAMMDAIGITANTMSNIWFFEALQTAQEDVSVGSALSEPIERAGIFPPLVYHMLHIGEEAGDVDGMLSKLADYYEDEVEQATQQIMAALEPMIIILLAVIVGTIILSVIAPMGTMYSALDSL